MKNEAIGTGYGSVDTSLDGLYPGDLLVIAGRPGMGKSAVAADMATFMASEGTPVLYIDLESLGGKLLTLASEYIEARSSENQVIFDNLEVEHRLVKPTIDQIASLVYEDSWAKVVFVDYIQLADVDPYTFDAVCKLIFPDKIFIWCSMLPRPKSEPPIKRQSVKDLSHKLGFVPDTSVFLYREEYYSGDHPGWMELSSYSGKSLVSRDSVGWKSDYYAAPLKAAQMRALDNNGKGEKDK